MYFYLNLFLQAAALETLKNGDIDLFRDLVNETVVNDGYKARKGKKKIVDIELQYEEENDKTLLQVAVDDGKVEALQVTILRTYHCIFFILHLITSIQINLMKVLQQTSDSFGCWG